MEKFGKKSRRFKFNSEKNQKMLTVLSKEARQYATFLEQAPDVKKYEVGIKLNESDLKTIDFTAIRKDYINIEWTSDFLIYYKDERKGIREIGYLENIYKESSVEKFELSRRYWESKGIVDWKIVLMEER